MNKLLFLSIFFAIIIYLTIHIVISYQMAKLNLLEHKLDIDKLNKANFLFQINILSTGIFLLIFLIFFIPKSYSFYNLVMVKVAMYITGLIVMYAISTKREKELLYMNMIISSVNGYLFSIPILLIILTLGIN